jgi:hypothetical protein
MEQNWTDILEQQPEHGARTLMRFSDGKVRIGDYNRFDWRQWGVAYWKSIPDEQRR